MAPIDARLASPVRLTEGDMEGAMALSAGAGWNQLPEDWRLFMRHGTVLGLFDGPLLAASAAVIPYGEKLAWISMVLTAADRRGRGFGTALLGHCVALVESAGRTAFLDATPAGEVIYRKLGFDGVAGFTRWTGVGGGGADGAAEIPVDAAIRIANRAFGADRTVVLENFASRRPRLCRGDAEAGMAAFGRDGRIATQIGPVVAPPGGRDDPETAALVAALIGGIEGAVFLDVADECTALAACLAGMGFTRQRGFLRMKRGGWTAPADAPGTAVIAGPEFG